MLSQIDVLASSNPGAVADPAHIDLFADAIIALSGKDPYTSHILEKRAAAVSLCCFKKSFDCSTYTCASVEFLRQTTLDLPS